MNDQTISLDQLAKELTNKELIKEYRKKIAELTPPKKPQSEATINKREFSNDVMTMLLSLGKTSKAVKNYLDGCDLECFKALLTDKQKEKFVSSRYDGLIKSISLVCKCFTPKQYESFKLNENKCTPSNYLSAIIRGCTMSQKAFDKCRKAKKHYSIDE